MWKRPLLRNDIYLSSAIILLSMKVASQYVRNTPFYVVINIVIVIGGILLATSYFSKGKLPGESRYNSKHLIEFHIGNSCNGNFRMVGSFLIDVINIAQRENRNVVFSSDFFYIWTVEKIFQSAVVVYRPSFADRISGKINKIIYRKKQRIRRKEKPLINCYIYADRVNEEMVEEIKRHFRIK